MQPPWFMILKAAVDRLRGLGRRLGQGDYSRSLSRLVRSHSPVMLLDVGACVGDYALHLRRLGFAGAIHSFEPIQANYEQLARRAAGDPHWRVWNVAIGDQDTVAEINEITGTTCHSFYQPNTLGEKCFGRFRVERRHPVAVRRLDGLLAEIGATGPLWLKTDTEGHDLAVLNGVGNWISAVEVLQVELAINPIHSGTPSYLSLLEMISQTGFEPLAFEPVNREPTGRLLSLDGLFVRTPRLGPGGT